MKILAIESSCDETAASVVEVLSGNFKILSNVISSQVKVHAKYGGIIPELAARLHVEKILPIIETALAQANLSWKQVDYIAVTGGPGLLSSLMVGVETAKTLAYVYNIPLVRVNHVEGHLLSSQKFKVKGQKFPTIGLVVSGGHTQIILVKDYLKYKLIGETRDDAAGEAFDKVAKILGLGYPGGPAISVEAKKVQNIKLKIKNLKTEIKLPRPMIDKGNFDMSFSGLKTAVRYLWEDLSKELNKKDLEKVKPLIAKEFQEAVIDVLVSKTLKAVNKFSAKSIILGGGVSANGELRKALSDVAKQNKIEVYIPDLNLTGDNAAMIGLAAYYHIKKKDFIEPFVLRADPQWELV